MGDNTRYNWTFMLAYNIYDGPEHVVYLDAYYIDKYEVTNEQYKKFVEETGYRIPRCWNDARFNRSQLSGCRDYLGRCRCIRKMGRGSDCLQKLSGKKQQEAQTGVYGRGEISLTKKM